MSKRKPVGDSVYSCMFLSDGDLQRHTPLTLTMTYPGGAQVLRARFQDEGLLKAVKLLQAKQLADIVHGEVLP